MHGGQTCSLARSHDPNGDREHSLGISVAIPWDFSDSMIRDGSRLARHSIVVLKTKIQQLEFSHFTSYRMLVSRMAVNT
jgi:hypothetical protein